MKKILMFAIILVSTKIYSQELNIPETDFTNVCLLIKDNKLYDTMEKRDVIIGGIGDRIASDFKNFGRQVGKNYGGYVTIFNIEDTTSSIHVEKNTKIKFIIKNDNNQIDPYEIINIFYVGRLPKRSRRMFESTSNYQTNAGLVSFYKEKTIKFNATKYGKSSYLVEVIPILEPGEYGVHLAGHMNFVNLFTIDE